MGDWLRLVLSPKMYQFQQQQQQQQQEKENKEQNFRKENQNKLRMFEIKCPVILKSLPLWLPPPSFIRVTLQCNSITYWG